MEREKFSKTIMKFPAGTRAVWLKLTARNKKKMRRNLDF